MRSNLRANCPDTLLTQQELVELKQELVSIKFNINTLTNKQAIAEVSIQNNEKTSADNKKELTDMRKQILTRNDVIEIVEKEFSTKKRIAIQQKGSNKAFKPN